jgi:hypothetical protein
MRKDIVDNAIRRLIGVNIQSSVKLGACSSWLVLFSSVLSEAKDPHAVVETNGASQRVNE